MNAATSREIGQIFGSANPPPSMESRSQIIAALMTAETVQDLPKELQDELKRLRSSAAK